MLFSKTLVKATLRHERFFPRYHCSFFCADSIDRIDIHHDGACLRG